MSQYVSGDSSLFVLLSFVVILPVSFVSVSYGLGGGGMRIPRRER